MRQHENTSLYEFLVSIFCLEWDIQKYNSQKSKNANKKRRSQITYINRKVSSERNRLRKIKIKRDKNREDLIKKRVFRERDFGYCIRTNKTYYRNILIKIVDTGPLKTI
ncbi:MAG: hypothetical protein DRQ88_06050 [Epsilonproteobacteria bacterium]|nr:MAG: hypothetical protein DRQ88_06050 [Campylobacterota bacterium]